MKILTDAQYKRKLEQLDMLGSYNTQLRREVHELQSRLSRLNTPEPPTTVTEVVTKVRIEQAVFDALEKELPRPCVPKSELEAGVLLGVQMVLERVRKGWLV